MANIGAFVGEIAKAIKTDPSAPQTIEVNRTEQSEPVETTLGPAVATTRTVDEVAVTPAQKGRPAHVAARRVTTKEVVVPLNPPPPSPPHVNPHP